jgi:hypothetical protein
VCPHDSHITSHALPQVGDLTLAEVQRLQWPSGQRVARVSEVLALVSSRVSAVILDVKPYVPTAPASGWVWVVVAGQLVLHK